MLKKTLSLYLAMSLVTGNAVMAEETNADQAQQGDVSAAEGQADPKGGVQEQEIYGEAVQEQKNVENNPVTTQQQSAEMSNTQTQGSDGQTDEEPVVPAEQTQTADANVDQSQTVNNGTEVTQSQTATAEVDRQQSYEATTGKVEQGQDTKVHATQDQVLSAIGEASAEQGQDVTVGTSQSQKVLVGDEETSQHQGALVESEQDQYANVMKDSLSTIVMGQEAAVTSVQEQQMSDATGQTQDTTATNLQTQDLQTTGPAEIGQSQSVATSQAGEQENMVTVVTKNVLTIFERATKTFVTFLQEITIDGKTETIQREYELQSDELARSQVETITYEWGTITAANCGRVHKESEANIVANITSFISVVFGLTNEPVLNPCGPETVDPKPEVPQEEPKPVTPTPQVVTPQPQVLSTEVKSTPVAQPVLQVVETTTAQTLPNTATNSFNSLLLGLGLAAAGSLLYVVQRKKANVK